MSDHDWNDETVGSFSEEAERLFGAISQNLGGHLGSEAAECEWCPVCRAVRLVRDLDPEVKSQVAAAAVAVGRALTSLLDAGTSPPDKPRGGDTDIDVADARLED